jgi:hypothetical protein
MTLMLASIVIVATYYIKCWFKKYGHWGIALLEHADSALTLRRRLHTTFIPSHGLQPRRGFYFYQPQVGFVCGIESLHVSKISG